MAEYVHKEVPELLGLGKDMFVDNQPDTPIKIVVLSEYYGSGPALGAKDFSNRSVQLTVRAGTTREAKELCWKIFQVLNNTENRIVDIGSRMTMIYPRQTPFKMRQDSQGRIYYVFNMGVSTEFKI